MLRYLNKFNNYYNYFIYFIVLFFFWVSINTGSKYLIIDYSKNNDFGVILNLFRALVPYFFILFFFIFFKSNLRGLLKFDLIFKLFIIYGLLQLTGLIYIGENFHEHYWIVCLFALLFFFNFIKKKKDQKLLKLIFLYNNLILLSVFIISIFLVFKNNIFSETLLYADHTFNETYNYEQVPRSTGLSRMAFVLFIFLNSFYFLKNINKQIKLLIIIFNIILISIILLLQSRGVILSLILSLLLINYLFKDQNLKVRFKYLCIIIFVPVIIFILYPSLQTVIVEKYGYSVVSGNNYNQYKIKNLNININVRGDFFNIIEDDTVENNIARVSSNRSQAWKFLIFVFFNKELDENLKIALKQQRFKEDEFNFKIKKNNFLSGYGPQADRYFMLNSTEGMGNSDRVLGPFGSHASNGYIYSLVCSGILGFFVFLALNLIIFYKILKIIFIKKFYNFSSNPYLTSAILIILFLQFRILFENSFSVFGVDMLFLMSSYLIIEREFRNLKN